jgi:diguanylate cyclase
MAAANVPLRAVCRSAAELGGGGLVVLASGMLLSMTLFTSILDGRMQSKNSLLANSLRIANTACRPPTPALPA